MSEIRDKTIRESILSMEGNIVISADAGTGKTFMTVERIKCDVLKKDNYQTYAAITFTNKASKELIDRLGGIQQGFVGTNDKFILNEIIIPFSKDVYSQLRGKNIKTDYSESEKCNTGQELLDKYINEGIIGTYTDAHYNFAFQLALHILKKSHAARRYLNNRYFRIYIDEYQDSDRNMHALFMYINEQMSIPLFIVGDIKQSIYEWRGGYPAGFKNLLNNDKYKAFRLLHNFRSNEQIQNYASIFMDDIIDNYRIVMLNGEVQGCIYNGEPELITYIEEWLMDKKNCAFLVFSNREANEWADKLADLQFVYIPRAPIDDPSLENSQIWVVRCIANYFYKKRYSEFSFYDEIPNQEAYDITIIRDKLRKMKNDYEKKGWTKSSEIIVKELYEYLLTDYDKEGMKIEIQKLRETLEDIQYEKSFNIELYERVVTTIHSSKGLQYSQVIINSANFIRSGTMSNPELHYVAITRPEDRLLILFNKRSNNAKDYYEILRERVKKIVIDGVQQRMQNVIEMIQL